MITSFFQVLQPQPIFFNSTYFKNQKLHFWSFGNETSQEIKNHTNSSLPVTLKTPTPEALLTELCNF